MANGVTFYTENSGVPHVWIRVEYNGQVIETGLGPASSTVVNFNNGQGVVHGVEHKNTLIFEENYTPYAKTNFNFTNAQIGSLFNTAVAKHNAGLNGQLGYSYADGKHCLSYVDGLFIDSGLGSISKYIGNKQDLAGMNGDVTGNFLGFTAASLAKNYFKNDASFQAKATDISTSNMLTLATYTNPLWDENVWIGGMLTAMAYAISPVYPVPALAIKVFVTTKAVLNLSQKIFDPLVIDLGKDGITLISYEQSNAFVDLDNDGFKDHAGWIGKNASGIINDGLVFEDKNGNGKADGIVELVGGDDGTGNIRGAFDTLHQDYNTNGDLYFDSKDTKFNTMKLWIDANGNGTSETSEVSLLKSKVRGIYIPLDMSPSGAYSDNVSIKAPVFEAGNLITIESHVDLLETGESTTISNNFDFGDGAAKEIYFGTNTSFNAYTRPTNLTINQNALAMPNLRQSGASNTGGTPYWVAPLVDAMSIH